MDKLERLVETLKLIATSAPPKEHDKIGVNKCESGGGGIPGVGDKIDSELSLEETMQNYDIDADSLMQKFCQIISYETLKYEFHWNAESIFVDYMCREYNWLLGAEGYALVTLQQALRALCPPVTATATATAAKAAAAHNTEKYNVQNQPVASLYSSSRDSSRDDEDAMSRYSAYSRDNDARSRFGSRDEDEWKSDALGLSVHNNEILISSSSKMKGIAVPSASPPAVSVPVLGSE